MISLDLGLWQSRVSAFGPLSLSPSLWLDASDSATLFQSNGGAAASADGDPVGYWLDKSGNNRHVSQTDPTKKPLLKLSVQNGRNTIRFDGVNDYILNSTISSSVSEFWTFAVFKKNGATNQYIHDTVSGYQDYLTWQGSRWYINVNNFGDATTTGSFIFGNRFKANPNDVYKNSVLVTGLSGTSPTPSSTTGFILATYRSLTGIFLNGDIHEIIRIPSTITTQNRIDLFSYLNTKWAIY